MAQRLPRRPLAVALALVALTLVLASCGSSSSATTSAQQQGRPGFASNPKVAACLKKQGVTVPSRRNRPPRTGAGGPPPSGGASGASAARFQKLRAALKACGVTVPRPGQGRPGGPPSAGAPQTLPSS